MITFEDFKQKVTSYEKENGLSRGGFYGEVEYGSAREALESWGGKIVENFGGEGLGDTLRLVFSFPESDLYVQAIGSYASYDGSDWSYAEVSEVRPYQVTETKYR